MYSSHVGCLLFYLGQDGMLGKAEGLARGIDGTFLSVLSRWRDAISPTSRACDLPPLAPRTESYDTRIERRPVSVCEAAPRGPILCPPSNGNHRKR